MESINLFPNGGQYAGLANIEFGIKKGDKVLDIGGGNKPFMYSTHLIDMLDNNVQRHGQDVKTEGREFFNGDACEILKKFPDKYFDFVYTSHTLEHIIDLPPLLDQMSRVCKRGFNAFPGSDFEFLTAKKHFGHVNLLRVIDNTIHITKRLPNTILQRMAELFEEKLFRNPEFNSWWESHSINGARHIWECRHYWQNEIKWKYYKGKDAWVLFPQLEFFK